jgi:hypothetical protein
VALYSHTNSTMPLGCSESMFVHNNSKHGRRQAPYREPFVGDGKPYITSVYPTEGWTSGGTRVCIVGMNFFEGIEVVFGTLQASAEACYTARENTGISEILSSSPSICPLSLQVLSPNAIAVKTPISPRPGEVDITLVFKNSHFCINSPGKFLYIDPDEVSFDHNFARLERLLRMPEDTDEIPKDILLRRAADALEAFYAIPRTQQHMTQPNHGCFPTYYPRSPAIFTPLFTPQFKSPGFHLVSPSKEMFGGDMEHKEEGGGGGSYPSNPVSRCNSNEALSQQPGQPQVGGAMEGTFVFPQVPAHDSGLQQSSIQKPKPIPPSPMTAPMYPMAAMPYLHYHMQPAMGFPKMEPGTIHPHYLNHGGGEEGGNRNNNNSLPPHMGGQHPVHFAHHAIHGSPSHGYIMTGAPSVSPGPIAAATPGAQAFTFSTAGITNPPPSKALRGGVALQSPQFGTFLFPPTTPTGLIAPISLPDLNAPTDSAPSVSSTATTTGVPTPNDGSSSGQHMSDGGIDVPPPTKKSKSQQQGSPILQ